jgi:hypothetical protein
MEKTRGSLMAIRNGAGSGRRKPISQPVSHPGGKSFPQLRIESRGADDPGPCIRVLLAHGAQGREDYDLTRAFTSAIAHALWMARAGDDAQNWIDAEKLLEQAFGAARSPKPDRRAAKDGEENGPLPEPDLLNKIRRRASAVRT